MITCWPSVYEPEKGRPASLSALVRRIRDPKPSSSKEVTGRWAAASFRGHYRSLANLISVEALVLDVDRAFDPKDLGIFYNAFAGMTAWAHTTWTPGRWRIVVPLDTAVDAFEFPRVQRALVGHAQRWGIQPELGQSAAHCFALPCTGGAPYEWRETDGPYFDVQAALAQFRTPEPIYVPDAPQDSSRPSRLYRAMKYLEAIPGAVSGDSGHKTTFSAAVALVRGFQLSPRDALGLLIELYNPRCLPPWTHVELAHKVKQAARGQMAMGRLVAQSVTASG